MSSTDGYVSKFHFVAEELGTPIPDHSVPFQTKRLHPVVYGWESKTTEGEELPSGCMPRIMASGVRAAEGRGGRPCSGTKTEGAQESNGGVGHDVPPPRPRKKITPTFLTSLPGIPEQATPCSSGVAHPPVATLANHPPSLTRPQDEKKKRRIAPTLVHDIQGPGEDEGAESADYVEGSLSAATQYYTEPATKGSEVVEQTPQMGPVAKNSKKKRLAPTLVSSLMT